MANKMMQYKDKIVNSPKLLKQNRHNHQEITNKKLINLNKVENHL